MAKGVFKIHIDPDSFDEAVNEKMDEIADDIFANSQRNIVDFKIVDEGTLLKTANINRYFLHKEIVYQVPYADEIEFGRLPGSQPPLEPIKDWVRRKQIATEEKDINRIAWAIVKDIKENGKTPRPFLSPAIEQVRSKRK